MCIFALQTLPVSTSACGDNYTMSKIFNSLSVIIIQLDFYSNTIS